MPDAIQTVLVTGGAGFIGSHVVDALLNAGYAVRILDTLLPPTHDGNPPPWLNSSAEIFHGDVRMKSDWKRALQGMDAVIHLAAYMDNHSDVATYVRTNVESIALLFEAIAEEKFSIKKIIAASSQSVYGEGTYRCAVHGEASLSPRRDEDLRRGVWEHYCPTDGMAMEPVEEKESDALYPQIPYGISKYASELLLHNLGRRFAIPTVALRYSIAVGPHQSFRHFYSGALRAFAVNVLSNDPISMNEDARQIRDFVDVRDVARAHLTVLEDNRANNEIFNVGSGRTTRVIELAELVANEAGVPFHPLLTNRYRVGDARHSLMNVDKLAALGWNPEISLAASVGDYLAWLKHFGNLKEVLDQTYAAMRQEGILKKGE